MFKIGEKAVYIGATRIPSEQCKIPEKNEIVIISGKRGGDYYLLGYETARDGKAQVFAQWLLRKLDYDFVEEVIKQIKEEPVQV